VSVKQDCQLYIITPPTIPNIAQFMIEFAAIASFKEVACVQLRLIDKDDGFTSECISELKPLCKQTGTALIINDRPDLCLSLKCDGVHLGENDMPYKDARKLLGEEFIIGVTCGASNHKAMNLAESGADYVAFGSVYPSGTKKTAVNAPLDLIANWSNTTNVPSIAIGGITVYNCRAVIETGADFLAVCGGVWDHPNGPKDAVEAFAKQFSE
jgi:thiamine-phosphate pyrophosphorylase